MESVRQQKVGRLIQKEIGLLLQSDYKHLCDKNIVSVTIVRVAPDLGFARVYLSAFPTKEPKALVESLNESIQEISHSLYQRIKNQFRKMPEIRFYHDDSLDYADRINQILDKENWILVSQ